MDKVAQAKVSINEEETVADVLWLNASLSQGGSERVMTLLANSFAESGIDTAMVLLREGKEQTYNASNNLRIVQFRYGTKNKILILIKRFLQLRKLLRDERPKCVISFMWDINAFTILSCIGIETKVIVSERAHPLMGTQGFLRKFTQNWLYRLADKVVFQTDSVSQYFPKAVQKKSVVIPNPINPDLPERWKGEREKIVVAAGRLTEQKNFEMLIDAFKEFHDAFPDWRLRIYGEGPLRESLTEQINAYGISSCVEMPGFVDNLPSKMVKLGMYINSSNFEGISNVMLEAMSIGLPVICTDCPVGGAALSINNEENGLLIPVGDAEKLTHCMKRVAENKNFSDYLALQASKIRVRFSIEHIISRWKRIL